VTRVCVEDNEYVKQGTVLVEIDPTDYQVAVAQANADLATAEASAESLHIDVPITTTTTSSQLDATAADVESLLRARNLLRPSGQGSHRYFVTDLPERFAEVGARFLGRKVDSAEQVDL